MSERTLRKAAEILDATIEQKAWDGLSIGAQILYVLALAYAAGKGDQYLRRDGLALTETEIGLLEQLAPVVHDDRHHPVN